MNIWAEDTPQISGAGLIAEATTRPCRRRSCGHGWFAHHHYRRGTECALCPRGTCGRYRPGWWLLRLLSGR